MSGSLAHLGDVLELHARLFPEKPAVRDLERSLTFGQWLSRARRFANALAGLGLAKGDRVAVLAYNCLEWAEIYVATAMAGLIVVPINFRLVGPEVRFIVENSGARALIVQDELLATVEDVRSDLAVKTFILFKKRPATGYLGYEDLIARASNSPPSAPVAEGDPWTLMYTSGTTGNPKGAMRSHRACAALSLVTEVEMELTKRDTALLVMPMCHGNSLFFFGAFAYCGAPIVIYSRRSFDPEHLLRTLSQGEASFTSLVPTHYIMLLSVPEAVRARHDVSAVRKLLISSAPARRDTKLAAMDYFRNAGLYEAYGSTECGWVTMLQPDDQLSKLGSIGRECVGSRPVRLLDPEGNEVVEGEPGELYSSNAHTFDGYWNLPDRTREAFRGDYCTVGDLARRDAEGFLYLVDRKTNMIISGGENVYPSEVEGVLGGHPKVKDVAVVGVSDEKWGERVHAVIVPHTGEAPAAEEILDWCRSRLAGHKRPRSVSFIRDEEMPRTATGKVLHRVLRKRFEAAGD